MGVKGKPGALAILIPHGKGGPLSGPPSSDDPDQDSDSDTPSAEVEAAYQDYDKDPSAETLWRFVKACTEGGY